jgi:hypothetical protein
MAEHQLPKLNAADSITSFGRPFDQANQASGLVKSRLMPSYRNVSQLQ